MRLIRLLIATLFLLPAAALCVVGATSVASAATSHSVDMMDFAFTPANLSIVTGDTVTWTNHDTAPHDVTVTSGPASVHSPMLEKGQSWSHVFSAPGTYRYICSIHPDMQATLVVSAAPVATHSPAAAPRTTTAAAPVVPAVPASPTAATPKSAVPKHATGAKQIKSSAPSASASPVAAASSSGEQTRRLKPLLFVAGIVAAVATFCLLLLASRPDEPPAT